MDWTVHQLEHIGVTCDIFRNVRAAIDLDPRMPNESYLSQSTGPLALTVSYGAGAGLDVWLQRALAQESADVVIMERRASALCDRPAERVVLQVTPPPPPEGHRWGSQGPEAMPVESAEPFLLVALGAMHRGIPLLATFRRPASRTPLDSNAEAEAHFFGSFRCEP
jgi:hypothetical protein